MSSPRIINCTFSGNTATESRGGAVYFLGGACYPELIGCTFSDNAAGCGGGAVGTGSMQQGQLSVIHCTFIGNTTTGFSGGGIDIYQGDLVVSYCTFDANSAPAGAGISCRGLTQATIDHTIIAYSPQGEAISCTEQATATLACCDIYANEGGDWVGCIADQYGVDGNLFGNPCFCDPQSGDYRVCTTSPCAPAWGPSPECGIIGAHEAWCSGQVYVVRANGTGVYPNIQAAIDAVENCDIIQLEGEHGEPFTGDGNRDIDFHGKALILRSEDENPHDCIIDCEGTPGEPHRGFRFDSGEGNEVLLAGIGIKGGYGDYGGGIYCEDACPRFRKCTVFHSTASTVGGAVYSVYSANHAGPILHHCTLSHNTAPQGGGLYCDGYSRLFVYHTIIDSSFQAESVACAGAASAMLTHCDVVGNEGGDWVGCIEDQYDGSFYGNFTANPHFCNPEDDDYQLWNYSPCAQWAELVGALGVGCEDPQDIRDCPWSAPRPTRVVLVGNTPNPFASSTCIAYAIPGETGRIPARLSIFSAAGCLVQTLIDASLAPGAHVVSWNGTDHVGRSVEGGIYFCRLRVGEEHVTRRMLLIR